MQLQLTISFNGAIEGDGHDDIGPFTIRGHFAISTRQTQWTKAYVRRHSVEYEGVYDGRNILGVWTLSGLNGPFRIWPASEEVEVETASEVDVFASLTETYKI